MKSAAGSDALDLLRGPLMHDPEKLQTFRIRSCVKDKDLERKRDSTLSDFALRHCRRAIATQSRICRAFRRTRKTSDEGWIELIIVAGDLVPPGNTDRRAALVGR